MRKPIRQCIGKQVLVIDGAMGTLLMQAGIPSGISFEEANVTYPDIVRQVHREYLDAGADIIETNTFGGSPLKLADYGLADRAFELNRAGVRLAREAAGDDRYVAASMGPCGKLIHPLGKTTYDEVYAAFAIQARAFEEGGADIVSIETMGDLHEIKAAVRAVRDTTSLPVICSVTYDQNLYTMTGSDPYTVFTVLAAMGVEVIGSNCSMGPEGLVRVIAQYSKARQESPYSPALSVMPNAGLPHMVGNKAVYTLAADDFAAYAPEFIAHGVSLIGGCCGTAPAHIRALKNRIGSVRFQLYTPVQTDLTVLASRSRRIMVSSQHRPLVIGERLNPTARKNLVSDLVDYKTDQYRQEAQQQIDHMADLLDVNVGHPDTNEAAAMQLIVNMLVQNYDVPLCLDSSNPQVLEQGLRAYPGKALINSVNGEEKSLNAILPLARKYGAAVIGLTLDERGIPRTAEERLDIARRIVERAEQLGISRNDIFIDTLTLAVSSNQAEALETVRALTLIRQELGVKTSLGVSNISHGLPKRKLINHTFLAIALGAGLDAVIANPLDPFVHSLVAATSTLTGRDAACAKYIEQSPSLLVAEESSAANEKQVLPVRQQAEHPGMARLRGEPLLYDIAADVLSGNGDVIIEKVKNALNQYEGRKIIEGSLLVAMDDVGERFKSQRIFLPQVMASAEAMKKAFSYIKAVSPAGAMETRGTVIIATVKGDIHDIGKNIVAMMLENSGFTVVDLGKNVDSDNIIEAVKEHKADIVCLSALLTTTMPEMEVVRQKLIEQGLRVKIMLGGAVVTQAYADRLGAYYSADAIGASEKAKEIAG